MIINNSITQKRVKKALTPKNIAIVLIVVTVATLIFYVSVTNRDKKELHIWYITTETENCFSDEQLKLVKDYGAENGIDKVILSKRHPDDKYFDATMSTTAFYNCDVFIMNDEMVNKYAELGMFRALEYEYDGKLLYMDDVIGILIDENYYMLINEKSDIDLQIIYNIFDIFTRK